MGLRLLISICFVILNIGHLSCTHAEQLLVNEICDSFTVMLSKKAAQTSFAICKAVKLLFVLHDLQHKKLSEVLWRDLELGASFVLRHYFY